MAGDPDPYVQTLDTIELRRDSLSSGAPAASQGGAWSEQEVEAAFAALDADEVTLRAHWHSATQVVVDGEPHRCAECGEPRHCPTARELFARYTG